MGRLEELERLAQLHAAGALTDEEFAAEKQMVLAPRHRGLTLGPLTIGAGVLAVLGVVLAVVIANRGVDFGGRGAAAVTPAAVPPAPPATLAAAAASAPPGSKLQQVFQRSMLNAQVRYLEQITGPARNIDAGQRTYIVDGCQVSVGVGKDGAIATLGLPNLTQACTISLADFGIEGPTAEKLTFGDFEGYGMGGAKYSADCLRSCGNAFDPSAYAVIETPHVNNFIAFRIGAAEVADAALHASGKWEDAMVARQGEDYVMETRFNCEPTYDKLASQLFKSVRITSIEIGYDFAAKC